VFQESAVTAANVLRINKNDNFIDKFDLLV